MNEKLKELCESITQHIRRAPYKWGFWCVTITFILIPLLIWILYFIGDNCRILINTSLSVGEALGFYGASLAAIGTIALGVVSIIQNNRATQLNLKLIIRLLPFSEKDRAAYKNPDNDPRGPWVSTDCTAQAGHGTKNQFYELVTPVGRKIVLPDSLCWRFTKEKMQEEIEAGRIWFGQDGKGVPRKKTYLSERAGRNLWTWWPNTEVGHTQSATQELTRLLGGKLFDFSKPIELIKRCLSLALDSNSIVLDFFSGSATTAHAVMQLNAEDGGNRKFIMVQLPEPCREGTEAAKAGYKNICEIGKERIRRAGEKIKAEIEEKSTQLKIGEEPKKVPDIGFKVFKLDSSNLKKWQPDYDALETTLFDSVSNYVEGRSELDVVYEIMLKMGMELTWPLETHIIASRNVYDIGMGALMICLDDHITAEVAEGMAALRQEESSEVWRVVFKDNGFESDSAKVNIKEILKRAGLEEDAFTTV